MRPNCSDCAHYCAADPNTPTGYDMCLRDTTNAVDSFGRPLPCWRARLPFGDCGWSGRYFTDRAEGV